MADPRYFSYWGKASSELPPDRAHSPGWHSLAYHCLDVAAVADQYLRRTPALQILLRQSLGNVDEDSLPRWLAFWIALHDLGKFAESFQGQKPDLFQALRDRPPAPGKPYRIRHDSLGWLYWRDILAAQAEEESWFGEGSAEATDGLNWWLRAVTGHHGQPPESSHNFWESHFDRRDDNAAIARFVADLSELLLTDAVRAIPGRLDEEAFEHTSKLLSWWVAGVTVLADWLGSNTDFFPYRTDPQPLSEYWAYARKQARRALQSSGVLPPGRQEELGFSDLFSAIETPSPLQEWVCRADLSAGPQIYLLEDVTGAGKTEAAVMLAHRLMAGGCADGFFIGLPTMATANAMYRRIDQVQERLFVGFASLVLAHGQRKLVDYFAKSVFRPGPDEEDRRQLDETASARCAAWLADRNKSALLAPAGVGTVDQALLAVLHSKHQSLRLLGLLRKVLVVNEVHACDPYMQRVLETLLEFHAQAGGSAILLSATLPERMKQSLLDAFARGRGQAVPRIRESAYPVVCAWHSAAPDLLQETPLATRPDICRELAVRYVSEESEVIVAIEQALAAGKCVCWMRNTVFDALAAHAKFTEKLPPERLTLFHGRFAYVDRLGTEQDILESFGKDSNPKSRAGKLVIATQVAEQSLDADWDLVVSDLAPIDRLIQRAGRLQRHPRDPIGMRLADLAARDQRGTPCLWVFGPAWSDEPHARWFKEFLPKAAGVYPHHGQLWLTAKALRQGSIAMPGGARPLIESVFGPDADIPKGLEANANRAEGERYGQMSEAQRNIVKREAGYVRSDVIDWWSEAKTPSRLGEATTTVVLVRWEGGQLCPWAGYEGGRHAWAYSSLRMAERLIAASFEETDPVRKAAVDQLLLSLPGKGKWSVLLPLDEVAGEWIGKALSRPEEGKAAQEKVWRYSSELGLVEVQAPNDVLSGASPA